MAGLGRIGAFVPGAIYRAAAIMALVAGAEPHAGGEEIPIVSLFVTAQDEATGWLQAAAETVTVLTAREENIIRVVFVR